MEKIWMSLQKRPVSRSLLRTLYIFIDSGKYQLYGFGKQCSKDPFLEFHGINQTRL